MKKQIKLSVVIITKNEENMIEGAIKSVLWADEIIVIDAQSIDKTLKICKKYTKKVYTRKWRGFASQKNYGIKKAKGKWVLILDADERVSRALREKITQIINDKKPANTSYNILFRNFFLGREMKHGGWQGEYHIRLFQKDKAKYAKQEIHEFLRTKGNTGKINHPIYHFSHRDLASNLKKTLQYSVIESKYHYERGVDKITPRILFKNIVEHFYYRYVKARGYKDGMEGLVEAMYQAFSQMFIVQGMIWERQRDKTSKQIYAQLDDDLQKNNFDI